MARERTTSRPGSQWQPLGVKSKRATPQQRAATQRHAGSLRRTGPPQRASVSKRWRLPSLRLGLHLEAPRISRRWRRVGLVVAAASIIALGAVSLYQSPLLSIRGVSVEGNATLSTELLTNVADLEGQSIVRPNFAAAEQRLIALPMVKHAQIRRDWPTGARVIVVERRPWAVWQAGSEHYVIDDEGIVLDVPAPKDVPVIVQLDGGEPLAPGDKVDFGAIDVARRLVPTAERTLGRRVVSLEFSQASGLTAVLAGQGGPRLRARFGDANGYEFKIAALYAVLRQADQEGRQLREVDLRFGGRVAVRAGGSE